jgi:hypothetical protein
MLSTFVLVALNYKSVTSSFEVGPEKPFARIEDAVAMAKPGDTINIYPDPNGYPQTAVRIQIPSITIRGVGEKPVPIKGQGYVYSGSGSVPRAIFQIEPTAVGTKIENLNISGAHNDSFNGAGIRIQAASEITVSDCIIHDNDMGMMSNGKDGDPKAASNQLIQYCLIEHNGNIKDPGYNHNLYLGGTSVKVLHCEIRNSTTGHNVKSRAHFIEIDACYIHDASSREIDLPEAWDTSRPNSNALLIGNRIVKDPNCSGNRGVIHFGKEKGTRLGNIYLFGNTIVSPFSSPVVLVTAPGTSIFAKYNVFLNLEQGKTELFEGEGINVKVEATKNKLSMGYGQLAGNLTSVSRAELFGKDPSNYMHSPPGSSTGQADDVSWLDGEGKEQRRRLSQFEGSKLDGPRPRPEYR